MGIALRVGRNERCPCGSGKKYKLCCLRAAPSTSSTSLPSQQTAVIASPDNLNFDLPEPSSVQVLPIEIDLKYTFPEMFGIAEVTHIVPAGRIYELAGGTRIINDDLQVGMQFRLQDGNLGTITGIERRFEPPQMPVHVGGGLVLARVIGTIKHKGLETTDISWVNNTVTASSDHEFYSVSRQTYVDAEKLQVGEFLKGDSGANTPITSVGEKKIGLVDLYNIEVEHFHNYHVGTNPGVLVHNGAGGKSYINLPSDLGPARGPVRSQHYSHSPIGTRLHDEAQSFRAMHPDGKNVHRNFATADVTVDGVNRTVRFKNDPDGMHSEQRLVAWHEAMLERGRKVEMRGVYTERPPCGDWSANCANTLGNRYGDDLNVWHGDR